MQDMSVERGDAATAFSQVEESVISRELSALSRWLEMFLEELRQECLNLKNTGQT